MQWEHIKIVWMLRIYSKSAKPCTSQEWRDILSLGILTSRARNGGKDTATARGVEQVRSLIGDCIKAADLPEHCLSKTLPQGELQSLTVDIRRGRIMIWELCEFNFRWELQALDRRLYDRERYHPLQRQQMLIHCFSVKYPGITSVHVSLAATGLASPTFAGRFPYLQAFWTLMDDWH